ncbi:MAG: hypothetical protein KH614_08365, partial [Firmicutes bacterium]|nr:hypothetical protein [Bacillota bacterium]
ENAGILCVFQVFHTDGLTKKIRHPPQAIYSEVPQISGLHPAAIYATMWLVFTNPIRRRL